MNTESQAAHLIESFVSSSTKGYWITDSGKIERIQGIHSDYLKYLPVNVNRDISITKLVREYFYKGWIRVNIYRRRVLAHLIIPSISPRAVESLKKLIIDSGVDRVLLDDGSSFDEVEYHTDRFFKIYRGNKIDSLVILSNVQKFREEIHKLEL